jgi:hypothetical protein
LRDGEIRRGENEGGMIRERSRGNAGVEACRKISLAERLLGFSILALDASVDGRPISDRSVQPARRILALPAEQDGSGNADPILTMTWIIGA